MSFIEKLRERFEERPLLRKLRERIEEFRGEKVAVTPGAKLTEAQKRLAEEFRRGIAEALGVPPEAIREEAVERWVKQWTAAFVKPEYWMQARRMGYELGKIVRASLESKPSHETIHEAEVTETSREVEGGRLY